MRAEQESPGPDQRLFSGSIGAMPEAAPEPSPSALRRITSFFGRRKSVPEADPVDEIPAFQRAAAQPAEAQVPVTVSPRRTSIWERTVAEGAGAAPAPAATSGTNPVSTGPVSRPAPVEPVAPQTLGWLRCGLPALPTIWRRLHLRRAWRDRHSRARRCRDSHRYGGSQECERLQAAGQHSAECGRRPADGARRRTARRSQGAGGKMRRVRRARARWCRSIPARWSRPMSSSPRRASSTAV